MTHLQQIYNELGHDMVRRTDKYDVRTCHMHMMRADTTIEN
jgi:hypothetical protein